MTLNLTSVAKQFTRLGTGSLRYEATHKFSYAGVNMGALNFDQTLRVHVGVANGEYYVGLADGSTPEDSIFKVTEWVAVGINKEIRVPCVLTASMEDDFFRGDERVSFPISLEVEVHMDGADSIYLAFRGAGRFANDTSVKLWPSVVAA